ncbi:MAG: helix-turn-helix transcriptional regulator [Clostridia bacterium]|nr:helix-turn-helix transcriptional regulator [Clostridia bacterium]
MASSVRYGPKNSLKVHKLECTYLHFDTIGDTFVTESGRNTVDILFGAEGTVTLEHGGVTDILTPESMLILPIRENCTLRARTEKATVQRICVLPNVLYNIFQNVFETKYILPFTAVSRPHQIFFDDETLKDTSIPETIQRIFAEFRSQDCCFEVSMKIDIYSIFLWIARFWHKQGEMSDQINDISRGALNKLDFVLEYIEQNYNTRLDIAKLAYSVGFSYSYFAKTFKAGTGYKFTEYVNNLRLRRAEQMLFEKPDAPITYIAMECGFNSTSYFIQLFKERNGVTPNEFKRRQGV